MLLVRAAASSSASGSPPTIRQMLATLAHASSVSSSLDPRARAGYIDIHLSLATPAVAHQWLVYARAGHFTEIVPVAGPAVVSAYRLPFWHYVTPLVATAGRARDARRWVLLGTFLSAAGLSSRG